MQWREKDYKMDSALLPSEFTNPAWPTYLKSVRIKVLDIVHETYNYATKLELKVLKRNTGEVTLILKKNILVKPS